MTNDENLDDFAKVLLAGAAKMDDIPPSTTLFINEEGQCVELFVKNKESYYGDWIPGEGGDICLYRSRETNKVIGVCLPLYHANLMISRSGEPDAQEPKETA